MNAAFLSSDEQIAWNDSDSVLISPDTTRADIAARVGIICSDGSTLRIDIGEDAGYSCFQDVQCVADIAYIGYGNSLVVVRPDQRSFVTFVLDAYFGHLYSAMELDASLQDFAMLVASGCGLYCFSVDGKLLWHTGDLAVDGVNVHSVWDGVIAGSAEWDPPGGWRPFRLRLATGEKIQA